jgi:BirA family biotin operon repressor/biotin-[acetyl-CoA-carboxylase] ligase
VSLPRADFISRLERFERVASTQDVVRAWLADGVPEVCLAVADVQTAGRGRLDRRWHAGAGQALMVSAGFRPPELPMAKAWRLPAIVALSMLEAAEEVLVAADGVPTHRLALKWPNDIVVVHDDGARKLGGVLSDGIVEGERLATAVVGIGVNVDWPLRDFPVELADSMWSLHAALAGPVDREALLTTWLARVASRYEALRSGGFDAAAWSAAQVTTGADVEVDLGRTRLSGRGIRVDPESGALVLEDEGGTRHEIAWGEVLSCRVGRVGRVPGHL